MDEKFRQGLQLVEDWCSLHRGVEVTYVVDGYTLTFTSQDGGVIDRTVFGETLEAAIRAVVR